MSWSLRIIVCVVACTVGLACGGGGNTDAGTNCAIGQSSCSGVCVDTTVDTANCGACAHACSTGQVCLGATCYSSSCADATCTTNQVCNSGACVDRRCITTTCAATEA